MTWLPENFMHPERVALSEHHHLRPIAATDIDLDYPAVMGSQASLWARYGSGWGWPPTTMTKEEDRVDLLRHEQEMEVNASFNYALLPTAEDRLLGCVYIDPSNDHGFDAVVSWWLINELAGSDLESQLNSFVPAWLTDAWPFERVLFGVEGQNSE